MKQSVRHICTRCKLTSTDGNLWCQEVDCPAGTLPLLLKQGDQISNIRIDRLLRVLKTSTLYRVEIEGEKYLMKIANPGQSNIDYLTNEAEKLQAINKLRNYKAIPRLKKHLEFNDSQSFGVTTFHAFNNPTIYYYLMENIEGDFLYDFLINNPQPYHEHVGAFMLTLAEGIHAFHSVTSEPLMHLNLTPDTIMVVKNNLGIIQPRVIDMGLLLSDSELKARQLSPYDAKKEYSKYLQPSYFPPTMFQKMRERMLSPADDIYGFGILYHEMLRGEPTYPSALIPAEEIYAAIQQNSLDNQDSKHAYDEIAPIDRIDLPNKGRSRKEVTPVTRIVENCISINHYKTIQEVHGEILSIYGKVPDKEQITAKTIAKRAERYAINSSVFLLIFFITIVLILSVFLAFATTT